MENLNSSPSGKHALTMAQFKHQKQMVNSLKPAQLAQWLSEQAIIARGFQHQLSASKFIKVTKALASHPSLDKEVAEKLYARDHKRINRALVLNLATPHEIVKKLLVGSPSLQHDFCNSENFQPEYFEVLAEHGQEYAKTFLLSYDKTPAELINKMLADLEEFPSWVGKGEDCPPAKKINQENLERFKKGGKSWKRLAMAGLLTKEERIRLIDQGNSDAISVFLQQGDEGEIKYFFQTGQPLTVNYLVDLLEQWEKLTAVQKAIILDDFKNTKTSYPGNPRDFWENFFYKQVCTTFYRILQTHYPLEAKKAERRAYGEEIFKLSLASERLDPEVMLQAAKRKDRGEIPYLGSNHNLTREAVKELFSSPELFIMGVGNRSVENNLDVLPLRFVKTAANVSPLPQIREEARQILEEAKKTLPVEFWEAFNDQWEGTVAELIETARELKII